jgi:hypothetical protein
LEINNDLDLAQIEMDWRVSSWLCNVIYVCV